MAKPTGRAIRDELIKRSIDLIQTGGIGEFSYGALAADIGIKAPSIHHHFPHKEQLVAEVANHYAADFNAQVHEIGATSAVERIVAYAELYATTARSGRTCLCGAIAAEWASIGAEAQVEVEHFFAQQVAWLRAEIRNGQRLGQLRTDGVNPLKLARAVFATLQGSLLLARSDTAFTNVAHTIRELLSHVSPSGQTD
jgi:TetR/AcrR family transcriptional regulator, transcriptional repressor for nem operon